MLCRSRESNFLATVIIAGMWGSVFAGCGSNPQQQSGSQPHAGPVAAKANVLLITLDTLRADRLPPYGYTGVQTPALARLAREGVRFAAAYAPVPLTLPSHASMFTGLLPPTHGVRDNGGFYLNATHPTLAEALKKQGYATAAFVSAFVLDSRWGLARGFDRYHDDFSVSSGDLAAMASIQRPARDTWNETRGWLDARGTEPFFAWMHFFDAHTPYAPPEPFRSTYAARPYDGEIAYVDSVIADVLRYLEGKSLLENTVVIVTADHGEGLGEHEEDEHGLLLYDSTLHVPWIVRLPNAAEAGRVISAPVGVVDLFPTIAGLLGIEAPAKLHGVDRAGWMVGTETPAGILYAETHYPRLRMGWSELAAIRDGEYKYIRGPDPELYDYRTDPGETTNLASQKPEVVARFDRILSGLLAAQVTSASAQATLDSQSMRQLQALGYVAGSARPADTAGGLPDPKRKTGLYRDLTGARQELAEGREAAGVTTLQQVILADLDLQVARRILRDYWIGRRRFGEATRWLRSALNRVPEAAGLWMDLAVVLRTSRDATAAREAISRALDLRPDDPDSLIVAGEIERDAGQLPAALAFFKRAAERSPGATDARMQSVQTLLAMRNVDEARLVLRSVLATDPNALSAHYLLAQVAELQNDLRTAEAEYREEISRNPWEYRARFNLSLLLSARVERVEALSLLQSIPALAPDFMEVDFYIAKALLDLGDAGRLKEAAEIALRGLRRAPSAASAPLGNYVLADIYRLTERPADAARELERGQALERRLSTGRR